MKRKRWWGEPVAAIWVVGCLGCAGRTGLAMSFEEDSGPSGIAASSVLRMRGSTLSDLTAEQGAQLCDWTNQQLGGYGRSLNCPVVGARATDRDRAYCISGLASCPGLTVGDIEDCTLAQGADICKYFTATECSPLWTCTLEE
jgi:hypothetical protein